MNNDPVHHPKHYTQHPSGIECIDVVEYMTFNIGNAIKYLWRAGRKHDAIEDLNKAIWYATRERDRLIKESQPTRHPPSPDFVRAWNEVSGDPRKVPDLPQNVK